MGITGHQPILWGIDLSYGTSIHLMGALTDFMGYRPILWGIDLSYGASLHLTGHWQILWGIDLF